MIFTTIMTGGSVNINATTLKEHIQRAGVPCTSEQAAQLHTLFQLFVQYNTSHDLSRLRKTEDIVLKHFVDSAMVLRFAPELPSPLLDIGTGPAFRTAAENTVAANPCYSRRTPPSAGRVHEHGD